ncbi:DUF1559 domain-containing protein [Gimesia sp.]|uniref:DUF1559 family PulG-like putative transporter n=1 Tax=Gimesia sp. TaxID=2024833 RepID=UPI003A8D63E0
MNSNSETPLLTRSEPDDFTPSAGTLFLILAGCLFAVGLMIFLFTPVFEKMEIQRRKMARQVAASNHLKQIGLGLLLYHEEHQTFPAGATLASNGTPLHSWQTSILPFMDQTGLFEQIDFEKPWNDPVNQPSFQQQVPAYLVPGTEEKFSPEGYALSHFVGNELLLQQKEGMPLSQITDGESNTIMAVDRGDDFKAWGDPANLARPADVIGPDKKTLLPGGNLILFSDGRVQFVSNQINPRILKALSTPAGGETKCDL